MASLVILRGFAALSTVDFIAMQQTSRRGDPAAALAYTVARSKYVRTHSSSGADR
jgi:hypothetical protein